VATLCTCCVCNKPSSSCTWSISQHAPKIPHLICHKSKERVEGSMFQTDGQGLSFNPEHERPPHWSLCTSVCSSTPRSNSTQAVLINQFGPGECGEFGLWKEITMIQFKSQNQCIHLKRNVWILQFIWLSRNREEVWNMKSSPPLL